MKSFTSIEQFMNSDRARVLGLALAILLAACAVIGFVASFVALFGRAPVFGLLFMFGSIAIPLSIWLMVWHVAFSGGTGGQPSDDLAKQVERIGKSVDSIRKTVKAMDIGAITTSLDELKTASALPARAKRATPARRKTSDRASGRAASGSGSTTS